MAIVLRRTHSSVAGRRDQLGISAFKKKRRLNGNGYRIVRLSPTDQLYCMARSNGDVMEHRLVMARHLQRPLAADEFVHHRNGVKTDNRLHNLELWTRSHPDGQRVDDVLDWCIDFIERYAKHTADFLPR